MLSYEAISYWPAEIGDLVVLHVNRRDIYKIRKAQNELYHDSDT
jgi:hypothetical protein